MLRICCVAVLTVLSVASSSFAGAAVSGTFVPTPGLPGYATFTLVASTNYGWEIVGFDFASQSNYGIFGPLNQVNPAGLPTIFQDANAFFPFVGADVAQDSQFRFSSAEITFPAGFSSESATQLRSVFASPSSLGTSVDFVQLVLPPLATVNGVGTVIFNRNSVFIDGSVSFQISNPLPEPAAVGLAMSALIGGLGLVRRRPGARLQSSIGSSLMRRRGMLRGALAVAIGVVISGAAPAGVIISQTGVPTFELPGFTTWTLTATTDSGDQIVGFDFASRPSYGFYAPVMNQVNPVGLPTIFQDNNGFFPFLAGTDVSQDSQFKFYSTSITVPQGFASESEHSLRAVFAAGVSLGTSVPFVQIVTDDTWGFGSYIGSVTVLRGGDYRDVPVQGGCLDCGLPFIVDAFVDNVDANVPGFVDQRLLVFNAPATNLSLDSYIPAPGVAGSGPAIAAVLGPGVFPYQPRFRWNTVGSPPGTYKWLVTATNFRGTTDGSITVRITVPEPAILGLIWVVVPALLGPHRRRISD